MCEEIALNPMLEKYLYLCKVVANKFKVKHPEIDVDDYHQLSYLALMYAIVKWDKKKWKTNSVHYFLMQVMLQFLQRHYVRSRERVKYSPEMKIELTSLDSLKDDGYEISSVKAEKLSDKQLDKLDIVKEALPNEYEFLLSLYSLSSNTTKEDWNAFVNEHKNYEGKWKRLLEEGKYSRSSFRQIVAESVRDTLRRRNK